MAFPKAIEINEEGPREGFQIEKKTLSFARARGGGRCVERDRIEQNSGRLVRQSKRCRPWPTPPNCSPPLEEAGVTYTPLYLNAKGFERARQVSEVDMEGRIHFYTTDQFALQNNNRLAAQVRDDQIAMIDLCVEHGAAGRRLCHDCVRLQSDR